MVPDKDFQISMEEQFSRNQLIPTIKAEFNMQGFHDILRERDIPEDFGIALLAHMAIHKQTNIQTMVGILRPFFKDEENPTQACADMILRCVETDIVNYHLDRQVLIAAFVLSEEMYKELDKFQFPMPMVVPPEQLKNNRDTGYLTFKESLIMGGNYHEEDICLDHLNRMNRVELSINIHAMLNTKNNWKNIGVRKPGESGKDYLARHKAFHKYNTVSMEVMEYLISIGNRFWLTNRVDKRGRTYSVGYHVNPQGTDWNKAVIQFAEGEIVSHKME